MPILELKNVSKSYGEGAQKTEVLRDISLSIDEGEFLAIVGFSGRSSSFEYAWSPSTRSRFGLTGNTV